MNIKTEKNGSLLNIMISGSLDTVTAPSLETMLEKELGEDVTELVFDLTDLEYVSSAGLRVLLAAQRKMNKQGEMKITNVNEEVSEIFEITGFIDILDIE